MGVFDFFMEAQIFMSRGGWPMALIMLSAWIMWIMIFERWWFFSRRERKRRLAAHADVLAYRSAASDWALEKYAGMRRSEHRSACRRFLPIIGVLVKVCPLLGLLGTVLGMIEVFDVLAVPGGGNVRPMAAGISKATLTTMAGMVVALPGLLASNQLTRLAQVSERKLARAIAA